MKKALLLALFASMMCHRSHAQKKSQEVIFLKNGSVIRGAKSLTHLDSLIEVRTADGSVFRFESNQLDRIAREARQPDIRSRGYFIGVELGINSGRTYTDVWGANNRANTPTFQLVTGYHWNSHWSTGVGAGLDIYQDNTFMPIFARGMYMPLNTPLTPVFTMDAGYGFYNQVFNKDIPNTQTVKGGLLLNPAVGFMARSNRRTAFLFTMGYRQQESLQSFQNGEIRTDQDFSFRRLSLRMSLLF
jgi:hypothetical protein